MAFLINAGASYKNNFFSPNIIFQLTKAKSNLGLKCNNYIVFPYK